MIAIANETLIPLREAPNYLPKRPNGKRLHISVFYRWIRRGVNGLVLDAIRIGGTTYTSVQALERFAGRVHAVDSAAVPVIPQNLHQQRAAARLNRELGL